MTDAAQKIAERVPLPETPIYMLAVDGVHAHFTDGSGAPAEQMVESVCIYRPGAKCDVTRLYTAAQMEALRLAVAAEALRGDSPAATVEEISFDCVALLQWHIEPAPGMALFVAPQKALMGAEAVAKIEKAPNGMIGLFRPDGGPFDMSAHVGATLYAAPPAGSVEVTDAMVERACAAYYVADAWKNNTNRTMDYMRAALTAALHGDSNG